MIFYKVENFLLETLGCWVFADKKSPSHAMGQYLHSLFYSNLTGWHPWQGNITGFMDTLKALIFPVIHYTQISLFSSRLLLLKTRYWFSGKSGMMFIFHIGSCD